MLLLNGGDNFQGSLFYTTYKGAAEAEFLNQMKFDAMTVGNHEFDDGEDALAPFLDVIKFPVLSRQRAGQRRVQGRRPHQAVDRARGRRPEDRHRRRGHHRHAGDRLARPQHHDRGRHRDDHGRGREAEGRGRQQDHRADPCRLSPRQGDDRQDPRRRRGGRRPLAFAAVEHRRRRPKVPTRR